MSADLKIAANPPAFFVDFCRKANIEPTRRQLAAWKRGEGTACELAKREAGHNRKVRAALVAQGIAK